MTQPIRVYSERKTITAGTQFPFVENVPREGPNGGRMVIRGIHCYVDYQVDVAAATAEGEDLYRFLARIQVIEAGGLYRWNLTGPESRVACYQFLGPTKVREEPDIAAGNDNLGLVHLYVPMAKPMTHTPDDFALPADELREVRIQAATTADLQGSGTATFVIDSAVYYLVFDCVEEHDLQFKCKDVVESQNFTSITQSLFQINGKLHDFIIWKAGQSGGSSLANLTDVRITDAALVPEPSKRTELLAEYRYRRGVADNLNSTMSGELRADPFTQGTAVSVLMSDSDTSCFDGPYLRQIRVDLTNTVAATLVAIMRIVRKPDPASRAQVAGMYELANFGAVRVKTGAKTKQDPKDWPDQRQLAYLPMKASFAAKKN